MKRNLSTLALALLTATASLAAVPPLSLQEVRPLVGGDFIYQKMVRDEQAGVEKANLLLDLILTNTSTSSVTLDRVELNFFSPTIPTIVKTAGLKMSCPYPWIANNTTVMSWPNLVLQPGQTCRLGLVENPVLDLPAPTRLNLDVYAVGFNDPLQVAERDLFEYTNDTSLGSYRFPGRAEDLNPGEYWTGRNATSGGAHRFTGNPLEAYAYDLGVARYEPLDPAEWVPYTTVPGASARDSDDDYLVWGKKVYAITDGTVTDCWEGSPDNDNNMGSNFIEITQGSELIRYSHLQFGSVPDHLCTGSPVPVAAGDEVGKVGSSGTGSPHLHIHVNQAGQAVPLLFNDIFHIDKFLPEMTPPGGNAPWAEVDSCAFSFTSNAIWPSGLRRRGEATDVGITSTSIVHPSSLKTVTASRTTAGNLRVSLWNTDSSGEAVLQDTDTGGAVAKVSLAVPLLTSDAALAMITAGGSLKIAAYDVAGNTLTRTGDLVVNPANDVAATHGNFSRGIVTAVQTQSDTLKVIAFGVDTTVNPPVITRRGENARTGTIQDVEIVRTTNFGGVVVATLTSGNRLKLSTFSVTSSGNTVSWVEDEEDSLAQQIAITRLGTLPNGHDLVVTAIKTFFAGTLEVATWSIDSSGGIHPLDNAQAGTIGEVSVGRANDDHVLTSVSDSVGNLKVIAWQVDDNGLLDRRTESTGGPATAIRQDGVLSTGTPSLAVTALANNVGELELVVHQVLLTSMN